MHVMTSSIPFTHPLNTPKTIQTPSSLVDSSLDSYAVSLFSVGFKVCLFFIGWLAMSLVIFGLLLHMFGSDLNIYGLDFKSIYHSYLLIYQFYPAAHHFPIMALYTHGDTIPLVFTTPCDNTSDILDYFKHHFRMGTVLHQFERKIHGIVHQFAGVQGTNCIESFTL